MSTTNAAIITMLLTVAGRWADDKKLDAKIIVGGVFVAVVLSALNSAAPDLAGKIGWLIVVGAMVLNGKPLFDLLKKVTS